MPLRAERGSVGTGDEDLPTRSSLGEKRAKFGRNKHALATMAQMAQDDEDVFEDDARPEVSMTSPFNGEMPVLYTVCKAVKRIGHVDAMHEHTAHLTRTIEVIQLAFHFQVEEEEMYQEATRRKNAKTAKRSAAESERAVMPTPEQVSLALAGCAVCEGICVPHASENDMTTDWRRLIAVLAMGEQSHRMPRDVAKSGGRLRRTRA